MIHDQRIRRVRERDLFDRQVWLQLPVRRVDCLRCGRVSEHIDWLPSGSRLTRRMQCWIEALVQYLPIRHVSQLTGVGWYTIKEIDKRRLQTSVGTIELGEVRRLVMDEFALHKGHRYATVIMDAERTRVLWVGTATAGPLSVPSSSSSASDASRLRRWRWTLNTAFDLEVKQHCPQAEVVYDLFHVVARYTEGGGPGASGAGECTEKR